jgi:two-component system, cell cycle sensor histidine kinase and response regulator CckA
MWSRPTPLAALGPAFEFLHEACCLEDVQGRTAWVNRSYCRMFDLPEPESGLLELTPDRAHEAAEALCGGELPWRARLQVLRDAATPEGPETFVLPGGRSVDLYYAPVRIEGKLAGHVWRFDETTRRTQLEATLRQSQRLNTVGRLAGGIAHDFNNLLTAVVGYCDLLDGQFDHGDSRRFDLQEIRGAAMRAASLTRQLLAFSRRQVMQPEVVDVTFMLTEMQKMLVRLMGEQVQVDVRTPDEPADVFADPGQIEQVMFSLAVNARDAMAEGGTFSVDLTIESLAGAECDALLVKPGRYVHVVVADTGLGMDEETRTHAFEPFFTTKERAQRFGLGLGLPTAYGIVRQTGGAMTIESRLGEGTRVHLWLPAHEAGTIEEFDLPPELLASAATVPDVAPTVMVVEDEASVLRLVCRLLESDGCTVLSAQDADEALLLARQHQGPIHLLLTDVVMPGTNGVALAAQFTDERPGTPVLFMSGYADDAVVQREIIDVGRAFLQKPFAPDRLTGRVREVIAGR